MNNLSWFLYLVDVLNGLLGLVIFISVVGFPITVFFQDCRLHRDDPDANQPMCSDLGKHAGKVTSIWFLSIFLAIIIPAEKTMYYILGSEMSEEVLTSETAKRVYDAVNKKLDEYLHEDTTIDN